MDGDAGNPRPPGGDAFARRTRLDRDRDQADPVLRVTHADQRARIVRRQQRVERRRRHLHRCHPQDDRHQPHEVSVSHFAPHPSDGGRADRRAERRARGVHLVISHALSDSDGSDLGGVACNAGVTPGVGRVEAGRVMRPPGGPDTVAVSSSIGLGTWSIGGSMWGGTDRGDAVKTIRAAIERGITLIDTAPVYGFGTAEELVGRAIGEHGARAHVVIATKAGLRWRAGAVYRDASPARIRAEVEDSLRRLQTDYIDIYQVHWPDPHIPVEKTAAAMHTLYERGTIRAIGVSNFSPQEIERFRAVAPVHVIQSPYNLFERGVEHDVLPYAGRHGLPVFAYGALCRGLLSGRMRPDTKF